ncbi:MAG: hypothetical protein HZA79_00190 [Sphingobacteriales bacterium]|nr:hypothetical protein [Sphingobacteriales bacterium]
MTGLLFTAGTTSCQKGSGKSADDLYKNSPATAAPDVLKGGIWFWGGLSPISYYDRDGHELGNETEAAREYIFSEVAGKGRIEFWQYLGLRNSSNCTTEVFTQKKGTVVFEGTDRFTFYPVEGKFKTIKKGCNAGIAERKADAEDLKPETYLWEAKVINGEKLFYVYDVTDVDKQHAIFVYQYVL